MIQKRGKRWGVRIYRAGRQEWVGTFSTKREAREVERAELSKPRAAREETCDSFGERWLRDFPRKRASTRRQYGYDIARFAADFKGVRMSDVTRRAAREWALAHRAGAPRVRAMFNDALDEEIVVTNPFAGLRLDQGRGRKDLDVIPEADLYELADTALDVLGPYGPSFRACILFAAFVGCRPAELFLLKWTDIRIRDGEVRIRESLGGTGEITRPKNNRVRTVVLPPLAAEALLAMPRRTDSPYVFTIPRGGRLSKSSHFYYWNKVRCAAGRAGMDWYDLRHFCATHMLDVLGLDHLAVSFQLGHTDGGALVMSTYGHPSETAARERIRRAYGGGESRLRAV